MKRWLLHIWLMSVLGILAASCSQVIDDPVSGPCGEEIEANNVTIQFTLDLGELDGRTSRSSWEGYDGDGTDDSENAMLGDYVYENYIDVKTLEVIVLGTDGTYKGYVDIDPTKIVRDPENTNNGRRYTFEGRLEVPKEFISNQTLNCKLMVIANSGSVLTEDSNGNKTFDSDKLFDYNPENFHANATTKKYIPMWGIATYTGVWLPYGTIQKLDTPIYMLRSMAKIEVTMKDELYGQGYRIMGATLNKYLSQGLVMPKTITTSPTDVLTTKENVFNPVSSTNNTVTGTWGTSNFKDYHSTITDELEYKTWVIYVPEMTNQDNSLKVLLNLGKLNGKAITSITTTDELKEKHVVELKDYAYVKTESDKNASEVMPYDIVRNWYYQYIINKIEDGIEATLTVTANEWDLQKVSVNYKAEAATDGKIVWEANVLQNGEVKLGGNTMFTDIKFNLVGPTDGTWTATLIRTEGLSGAFSFDGSNVVEQVSGKVGETATLTIHAMNEKVTENCKAKLQIVVKTQDGTRTIDVTEMLNANHLIVQSK